MVHDQRRALRYDAGLSTLCCADSSDRWSRYDDAEPASEVAPLLAAIDEDVTGISWVEAVAA